MGRNVKCVFFNENKLWKLEIPNYNYMEPFDIMIKKPIKQIKGSVLTHHNNI
jgi:hypothetical protein